MKHLVTVDCAFFHGDIKFPSGEVNCSARAQLILLVRRK